MRSQLFVLACVTIVALAMAPPALADPTTAFEATSMYGVQRLEGMALGLDFDVDSASGVFITHLGVFDSYGDGLLSDHPVGIFDRMTGLPVLQIMIAAGTGALELGYRYVELPERFHLDSGFQGTIVAGYLDGNLDRSGNTHGYLNLETPPIWNGGGAMSNVGISRFGFYPKGYPNIPDMYYGGGPANRYHAGSFKYTPNPEPGTMVLLSGALAAAGVVRRRRKNRQQVEA